MKKLIALLLALVMVVGMVACGTAKPEDTKAPEATKPQAGNTETKPAETEAPESETPMNLAWYSGSEITTHFENVQWDPSLNIWHKGVFEAGANWNPTTADFDFDTYLASIESNADFTEWTVVMKDGVTFHDGSAATIADYVFSIYAMMLNPRTGSTFMKYVEGYQDCKDGVTETMSGLTYDEATNTATFKLAEAYWDFKGSLAGVILIPAAAFEGIAWADMDTADYYLKPIGTGPYMIDKVQMPDYFTLVRYDGYYGEKAGIKNINCINYNNSADAMATAIMNGDLDFVNRTAVADAMIADSIVAMNPNAVVMGNAGHGQRCWFFNLGDRADGKMKADLQKKEVRQAFDILMDEDAIADLVGATGTGTLVKSTSFDYVAEYDRPYDVAAAKALLDAAGFDYTQTYDFAYYYNEQLVHDAHTLIVQLFAAAGVKVNPILLQGDLAALLYTDKNYDLCMLMATASDTLPANNYSKMISTTSYTFMGLHEERGIAGGWDELYGKYAVEPDANKRAEISKQMQAKNFDECYALSGYLTTTYCVYDASHISLPEEVFTLGFGNPRFAEWKMLV